MDTSWISKRAELKTENTMVACDVVDLFKFYTKEM